MVVSIPGVVEDLRTKSYSRKVSNETALGSLRLGVALTRNNVARIHGILIFDKAKAVHKLDFGDVSSSMSSKMSFDIGFGSCGGRRVLVQRANPGFGRRNMSKQGYNEEENAGELLTISWEIPQVEASIRHFSHGACLSRRSSKIFDW